MKTGLVLTGLSAICTAAFARADGARYKLWAKFYLLGRDVVDELFK